MPCQVGLWGGGSVDGDGGRFKVHTHLRDVELAAGLFLSLDLCTQRLFPAGPMPLRSRSSLQGTDRGNPQGQCLRRRRPAQGAQATKTGLDAGLFWEGGPGKPSFPSEVYLVHLRGPIPYEAG